MNQVGENPWRPSAELRRFVWFATVTLVCGAWGSIALGFLGFRGGAVLVLLASALIYFYFQLGAYRQLEFEQGLGGDEFQRLRSSLRFFGPAGMLALAWRCVRDA